MEPSVKEITSTTLMFVTKLIDSDMKVLDQRHTCLLHCLPKRTNHFQSRKWLNRLQKVVVEKQVPRKPLAQFTSPPSQWGFNSKAVSEARLLTDLPLLNAALMNSSKVHETPLVRGFLICYFKCNFLTAVSCHFHKKM